MERGHVTIKLGGLTHSLRVEIGTAPEFEEASGLGLLALFRALYGRTATTSAVVGVIRAAMAANGKPYDDKGVWKLIEHEGISHAYVCAANIVAALFEVPAKEAGKAAKGKAPQ